MSKLERLKATRGAHRGVVSKLEKEANDLLLREEDSSTKIRLDVIYCLLENKLKTLSYIDNEIISLCEVEEITKEIEASEEIVARIIGCQRKIKESMPVVNNVHPSVYVQPEQHTAPTNVQNAAKPRLPKLSLPKFKGDVTKWNSFWDSFKSAIHQNDQISTIDKFNYLNSLLEGNAARTIQGLQLTSSNYNAAVEMLQERFGKPQIIVSAYMDEILKIQTCTDGRLRSLRYVYDKISAHVRGLASLGVSIRAIWKSSYSHHYI